jgi:hypothetical protein
MSKSAQPLPATATDRSAAGPFVMQLDNLGGDRTVQGNVLVAKATDQIRFALNAKLAVKGNYIDNSTISFRDNSNTPVSPVGSDTLMFYGSPSTPSTVFMAHDMAGVDLLIGDIGAAGGNHDGSDSNGNVRMVSDLTTSGNRDHSQRLDAQPAQPDPHSGHFRGREHHQPWLRRRR